MFYFCHLKKLVRPETFGPYYVHLYMHTYYQQAVMQCAVKYLKTLPWHRMQKLEKHKIPVTLRLLWNKRRQNEIIAFSCSFLPVLNTASLIDHGIIRLLLCSLELTKLRNTPLPSSPTCLFLQNKCKICLYN